MASLAHYLTPPAEVAAVGLAVTGAGWSAGELRERTARRSEYAGVLVTEGAGHLARGGGPSSALALRPGSFFWLPPRIAHTYGPSRSATLWSEHWVLFGGSAAAKYEALGLLAGGPTVVQLADLAPVLTLMREIVGLAGRPPGLGRDLQAAATLHHLIAEVGGAEAVADRNSVGRAALAELARTAQQEVSMAALAEQLDVSRDALAQQVRRLTGSTPTDFLLRHRLSRAKELLVTTDLAVSRVAKEVGYRDPAYFSRLFARRVGVPPTVFRAQNR